jgi:hypothetical protein
MSGNIGLLRVIRVAVTGLLLASLAACGTATEPPIFGSASGAASPRDTLLKAVPDGSQGNFAFTVTDAEATGTGVADPAAKALKLDMQFDDPSAGFSMSMGFVAIDQETWMKISISGQAPGLPKFPDKWLHLDRSKISGDAGVRLSFADPVGAASLFGTARDVESAGPSLFRGTVDLTAAQDAEIVDAEGLKALGEQAKALPFEATLDGQDRLDTLTIDVPAAGEAAAFKWVAKFHDYGAATTPTAPPPAQSQEAPASAYEMLNA